MLLSILGGLVVLAIVAWDITETFLGGIAQIEKTPPVADASAAALIRRAATEYADGQADTALSTVREAATILQPLYDHEPKNRAIAQQLADVRFREGQILFEKADTDSALAAFQCSLDVARKVPKAEPLEGPWEELVADIFATAGVIQLSTRRGDFGMANSSQAGARLDALALKFPEQAQLRRKRFFVQQCIGNAHDSKREFLQAIVAYKSAIKMFGDLAAEESSAIPVRSSQALNYTCLGDAQRATENYPGALASHEEAMRIYEALANEQPAVSRMRGLFGYSWVQMAKDCELQGIAMLALAHYKHAANVFRSLRTDFPEEKQWSFALASIYESEGEIYHRGGKHNDAQTCFQEQVKLLQPLASAPSAPAQMRHSLAKAYHHVGRAMHNKENVLGALDCENLALNIYRQIAKQNPADRLLEHDLGECHQNTALLQMQALEFDEGLANYRAAIGIFEHLSESQPKDSDYRRHLVKCNAGLGQYQREKRLFPEAVESFQKESANVKILSELDPRTPDLWRELATSCIALGDMQKKTRDPDGALASYRQALALHERLSGREPANLEGQVDLANSQGRIAQMLLAANADSDEARILIRAALNRLAAAEKMTLPSPYFNEVKKFLKLIAPLD